MIHHLSQLAQIDNIRSMVYILNHKTHRPDTYNYYTKPYFSIRTGIFLKNVKPTDTTAKRDRTDTFPKTNCKGWCLCLIIPTHIVWALHLPLKLPSICDLSI